MILLFHTHFATHLNTHLDTHFNTHFNTHLNTHFNTLISGIDYTMSNKVQGRDTFGGLSLHDLSGQRNNPYQEVRSY